MSVKHRFKVIFKYLFISVKCDLVTYGHIHVLIYAVSVSDLFGDVHSCYNEHT